ncbi:hypothetical protein RR42_m2165 [Cupriavidus basilensis]|uniref:Uncharacterized protein n=1 Tax=Cupriavidus basilensis TaxID=68895 RepID=A0A0C4Y2Z3_9BURK|nr:hypothetical protein RR42_m2165 [Cupriavidus basilensis]
MEISVPGGRPGGKCHQLPAARPARQGRSTAVFREGHRAARPAGVTR